MASGEFPDEGPERPGRQAGRGGPTRRDGNLLEVVRGRILEDLASGRMQPDSVVQLATLAERYGVSRTPVREALAVLEREGFVTTLPYKGYLLRRMEPGDVHDIHLARRAIEGPAAAIAATRMCPAAVDRLTASHPTDVATMSSDFDRYAYDFHHAILETTGSPRLMALFQSTYNDVRRLRYARIAAPRPVETHAEHEEILLALVRGDADAARERMEAHISAIRQRTLRDWLTPGDHVDLLPNG